MDTREGSGTTPLGPGSKELGGREEPRGPCFLSRGSFLGGMPSSSLPGHRAKQSRLKSFSTLC